MSSCGNPIADPEAVMPRRSQFDKSRMCVRCKEKEGNIVIRHAVYCKDCFAPLVQMKFRRAFEPHINRRPDGPRKLALKPSGDLLVGFSGGLGSTVLLDLVHRSYLDESALKRETGGKAHPRKGKVWKNVRVCYVEICDAFPGMRDRTEEIRQAVHRYDGFDFVPLRIQDAFDAEWWKRVSGRDLSEDATFDVDLKDEALRTSLSSNHSPVSSLQSYLQTLPTPSAVATSISTLTRLLLLYTAYSTGTSHLILGTSLTSLSIALISSISQGGGFTVPQEAHEEWTPFGSRIASADEPWDGDVRIIRPLRDIGMKECAAWAWWNRLPVVGKEKLPGMRQTIGGLTKDFIVGLEKDYPSTVSTVARTVGKLAPKEDAGGRCIFCERPAQSTVQEWKSRISIRSLAEGDPPTEDKEQSLTPLLCYFCHTTLTSRSSRSAAPTKPGTPAAASKIPLPVWVSWHLAHDSGKAIEASHSADSPADGEDEELWRRKPLDQDAMKAVVSEFLLDE